MKTALRPFAQTRSVLLCLLSLSPEPDFDPTAMKLKLQYFGATAIPSALVLEVLGAQLPGVGLAVGIGAAAAYFADDIHYAIEPGLRLAGHLLALMSHGKGTGRATSRLLNKDWWLGQEMVVPYADQEDEDEDLDEEIEDDLRAALADDDVVLLEDTAFTLSSLLVDGWRPSYKQIFLARLADGTDIFVSVPQLVHIALAGSTRQGKTSIIRQLLAQLCFLGCYCMLFDPHYTPYDIETGEDWTPFTPYLGINPMESRQCDQIEGWLRILATKELTKRKERRAHSQPVGRPIFAVIDEYPAIIRECPKVQEYVALLLQQGAKYHIFLCVASQDFQVKTISPQGAGALRENYKTCLYVGGDRTTAKILLDTVVPSELDATLGKGTVMLRCELVKQGRLAHTSLTDNQALYTLLGPSTYTPAKTVVLPLEGIADGDLDTPEIAPGAQPERATIAPVLQDKRPKAEDIDINVLCACWNGGATTVAKLEALFKMSHGEAYKAYKRIKAQRQEPVEEQE